MLATTPQPPYYAVIFTSQRADGDNGYEHMANRMVELAAQQPGYLGVESVRDVSGAGITVSYWESLDSITAWRRNAEHQLAQEQGRSSWYSQYKVRVTKVERDYGKTL